MNKKGRKKMFDEEPKSSSRTSWGHGDVLNLVSKVGEHWHEFCSGIRKKKIIWKDVAAAMAQEDFVVSGVECDRKWRNLKIRYMAVLEKQMSGEKSLHRIDYFDKIHSFLKDDPVTLSFLEQRNGQQKCKILVDPKTVNEEDQLDTEDAVMLDWSDRAVQMLLDLILEFKDWFTDRENDWDDTAMWEYAATPGVPNPRPAGHMRPARPFRAARQIISFWSSPSGPLGLVDAARGTLRVGDPCATLSLLFPLNQHPLLPHFQTLSEQMKLEGHQPSTEKCRCKWASLAADFQHHKAEAEATGSVPLWPYYTRVRHVLAQVGMPTPVTKTSRTVIPESGSSKILKRGTKRTRGNVKIKTSLVCKQEVQDVDDTTEEQSEAVAASTGLHKRQEASGRTIPTSTTTSTAKDTFHSGDIREVCQRLENIEENMAICSRLDHLEAQLDASAEQRQTQQQTNVLLGQVLSELSSLRRALSTRYAHKVQSQDPADLSSGITIVQHEKLLVPRSSADCSAHAPVLPTSPTWSCSLA
ncbi:hypothetical protein GWK47_037436 [Chionoecetes opilio]|uniref:Myb/SANT-like DNA-binding domain-containing protein n=1 Tax=Chionoecetes opilio TaxID=41210 RepID=A0A8J4YN36_CHIOP|nr:hypothetical protein GWK47_037436 [Chionoecetes opilio]